MLRKGNILSRGVLPVCVAIGDEGCIEHYRGHLKCSVRSYVEDHRVFVFNVRNAAAARLLNHATRTFLKTGFDFPNCLLGKRKDLGWCAESQIPKSTSLGWEVGSSCSVCGMWVSWGSTFVSSCCLVVGVCSVVAVSPSVVSSFAVIDGGMKNLKESIRR